MGYFSSLVRIGDTGGDVTFCRSLEPPRARVAEQKRGKVERERAYRETACVMHREVLGSSNPLRYPAEGQKMKAAGLYRRVVEEIVLGVWRQYYSIDLNSQGPKAIITRKNRRIGGSEDPT
jgi:hypothetical protein